MWENICLTNQEEILRFLDEYTDRLEQIKKDIKNGDADALTAFFTEAKTYRDSIL